MTEKTYYRGYQPSGTKEAQDFTPPSATSSVQPLREGYVRKGGINPYPSQIKERPPAPGSMYPRGGDLSREAAYPPAMPDNPITKMCSNAVEKHWKEHGAEFQLQSKGLEDELTAVTRERDALRSELEKSLNYYGSRLTNVGNWHKFVEGLLEKLASGELRKP